MAEVEQALLVCWIGNIPKIYKSHKMRDSVVDITSRWNRVGGFILVEIS